MCTFTLCNALIAQLPRLSRVDPSDPPSVGAEIVNTFLRREIIRVTGLISTNLKQDNRDREVVVGMHTGI